MQINVSDEATIAVVESVKALMLSVILVVSCGLRPS